jgi:hypothetical protein
MLAIDLETVRLFLHGLTALVALLLGVVLAG